MWNHYDKWIQLSTKMPGIDVVFRKIKAVITALNLHGKTIGLMRSVKPYRVYTFV